MAHKLNQAEQRVLEQCFIFCGVENKTGVAEEFGNKQKFLPQTATKKAWAYFCGGQPL